MDAKRIVAAILRAMTAEYGASTEQLDLIFAAIYQLEMERTAMAEQLFMARVNVHLLRKAKAGYASVARKAVRYYVAE